MLRANKLAQYIATTFLALGLLTDNAIAKSAREPAHAAPPSTSALAYATRESALYKVEGNRLYRRDRDNRDWSEIPVSLTAGASAITALSTGGTGTLYLAGPGLGVLASTDAGRTWASLSKGLPSKKVVAFATHSTAPTTLYAVMAEEGIYRSEDGGKRWRMMDKGPRAPIKRLIHTNMEGSMQTGWLYAATDKGVYRAMDCFCGFRIAGELPGAAGAVTFNPSQPAKIYVSSGRQVFRSVNGGEAWHWVATLKTDVEALAHGPDSSVYALLRDGHVTRSQDDGQTWE